MTDILNYFPTRWMQVDGTEYQVTNVTPALVIPDYIKNNKTLFLTYDIKDGETPRSLASRIFDDQTLYWVILLTNDISNVVDDWPISDDELYTRMVCEFGESELDSIVAYVNPNGNIVSMDGLRHLYSLDPSITDEQIISLYELESVSRYEMAKLENDTKRSIKIIDPDYVSTFIAAVVSNF